MVLEHKQTRSTSTYSSEQLRKGSSGIKNTVLPVQGWGRVHRDRLPSTGNRSFIVGILAPDAAEATLSLSPLKHSQIRQ